MKRFLFVLVLAGCGTEGPGEWNVTPIRCPADVDCECCVEVSEVGGDAFQVQCVNCPD